MGGLLLLVAVPVAVTVLVGMGAPIQDIWIARNQNKIHAPVLIGVGGLFDFFAGGVSRAPAALRGAGMEWVWRLAQEPRRMWQRYLIGNVTFMARAVRQAIEEDTLVWEDQLPGGVERQRLSDIPRTDAGRVIYQQSMAMAKGSPTTSMTARLLAIDDTGSERLLGEYTFQHTRTLPGPPSWEW